LFLFGLTTVPGTFSPCALSMSKGRERAGSKIRRGGVTARRELVERKCGPARRELAEPANFPTTSAIIEFVLVEGIDDALTAAIPELSERLNRVGV
jgi:hypothetical protein